MYKFAFPCFRMVSTSSYFIFIFLSLSFGFVYWKKIWIQCTFPLSSFWWCCSNSAVYWRYWNDCTVVLFHFPKYWYVPRFTSVRHIYSLRTEVEDMSMFWRRRMTSLVRFCSNIIYVHHLLSPFSFFLFVGTWDMDYILFLQKAVISLSIHCKTCVYLPICFIYPQFWSAHVKPYQMSYFFRAFYFWNIT